MVLSIFRCMSRWFRPAIDALTTRNLPWAYRWRLFALQPFSLIAYSIESGPYLFSLSRPFKEEWLQVAEGHAIRVLVFDDPTQKAANKGRLRPLHLDIHGGAFIGGLPEGDAPFCTKLAQKTGAVVVSASYRLAPVHPFPAAIDDIDMVVKYLQTHAVEKWGADPELMTTSGFSAGGNLALALTQQSSCHLPAKTAIKGSVTFYAAIDLQKKPQEKPWSGRTSLHNRDPLRFLIPLYDSYPGPVRAKNFDNPRMSPAIASIETLPENMLLVVPGTDILVHEQLTFVERVRDEIAHHPRMSHAGRRVEALFVEKGFHGYLGCEKDVAVVLGGRRLIRCAVPNSVVSQELKDQAFDAGVNFIQDVYSKHGWKPR